MFQPLTQQDRFVITGVGMTAPNGNTLAEYRANLLAGKSGVVPYNIRYVGRHWRGFATLMNSNTRRKKISGEALELDQSLSTVRTKPFAMRVELDEVSKDRVGVYLGITEHGNVETENEVYEISNYNYDASVWTHHHNPRTVANNPAGEVTINLKITGPHLTVGAACAAGNAGFIQAVQMLKLREVDMALAGGVSESIHTFGIFASFQSQGALAKHEIPEKASRPFDVGRNGIVVAEGGGICTVERLEDALKRGAKIYAEIVGYAMNSDATDFVLPDHSRQSECIHLALKRAGISADEIDIVSSHATATDQGDIEESKALRAVFGTRSSLAINNTKSFIGHAMGAAGALELLGNIPSFQDGYAHATINLDQLDPACDLPQLVANVPRKMEKVDYILNNSFGMLGINSVLIVKRYNGV